MNLYDDIEPLRVRGYASVFDRTYGRTGDMVRIAPGAFADLTDSGIYACYGHDPEHRFASVGAGTLRIWQDSYGLAFDFEVPSSWGGIWLASRIRAGEFREASMMLETLESRRVVENSRDVEVVTRGSIREISITAAGANPWTCVWLDDEGEDLHPYAAGARARWQAGRMKAVLAKRKPKASASRLQGRVQARARAGTDALVYARIDRILADARTRGLYRG